MSLRADLRMALGFIRPTGGSALLRGRPYAELAAPTRRIGVGLDCGPPQRPAPGTAFVYGTAALLSGRGKPTPT
ncbi:hypothetical protein [Streptomyces sp. NPDC002533]